MTTNKIVFDNICFSEFIQIVRYKLEGLLLAAFDAVLANGEWTDKSFQKFIEWVEILTIRFLLQYLKTNKNVGE